MVVQLRVDGRLIHGQFVLAWGKQLNTPRIIVVDDEAAVNKVVASTLHMAVQAASPDFKLAVRSFEDAVELIRDNRIDDVRVICVTRSIETACRLALAVPEKIEVLNVSYGTHAENVEVKEVGRMRLSDEDIDLLKQVIEKTNVEVVNWPLPYSIKDSIADVFKANGLL